MNARFAVSIVNWNTQEPLRRCLRVLGMREDIDIFVVDNHSSDGSAAMVRDEFPHVRLICAPRNLGFAGGNNIVLREAAADYVLVLNPDVEITPAQIDSLAAFFDAEPGAAAIGPVLVGEDGRVQSRMYRRFPDLAQVLLFWTFIGPLMHRIAPLRRRVFEHDLRDSGAPIAVDQIPGAAMLIRRAALERIGPMDAGYFVWWEDVDWCYRARRDGFSLHVLPHVRCTHAGGASFAGWNYETRAFQFYRAFYRFLARHGRHRFAHRITPLLQADFVVKDLIIRILRALRIRNDPGPHTLRETRREIAVLMERIERGEIPDFSSTAPDAPPWEVNEEGGSVPGDVDVVVVNWNGLRWLPRCLDALRASTIPVRITVVDNASADGSADYVATAHPDVQLVRLQQNRGYADGANEGLLRGSSRYAFVMNPDVLVAPDHLQVLRDRLDATPVIGAAQGKLYSISAAQFETGTLPHDVLDSAGHVIRRSRVVVDRGQGRTDGPGYNVEASVFSACGAALFLRRRMLEDIATDGWFAPSFFAYKEDIDLGWRARLLGWDVRYVPEAVAHHVRALPFSIDALRRTPVAARRHSWKNHYLLILRNDRLTDVVRHLPYIVAWEIARFVHALFRDPALLAAYVAVVPELRSALRHRRRALLRRRTPPAEMRKWFGAAPVPVQPVMAKSETA